MGVFCDRTGLVVTDHRGQWSDEHQGLLYIALDATAVGFNAFHHGHSEGMAGIGEQLDGLQQVEADQGFVDIHL